MKLKTVAGDFGLSKYVEKYTSASLVGEIRKQLDDMVTELATEIIDMYEVESVIREEAKHKLDKGKILLTVVMRKKTK